MRRLALVALSAIASCNSNDDASKQQPERVVACDSSGIVADYEAVPAADVGIVAVGHEELARDVGNHLGAMWGTAPTLGSKPWSIVLSTDGAPEVGYTIKREGQTIAVRAKATELAHGAYALVEILGARFFHPKQTFYPKLDGARIPKTLDVARKPAFATRGIQVHTLHPIEWLPALVNSPANEQNLADAKLLIDWLVRTGQNHLQWFFLNTVPVEQWRPHAAKIVEYAHAKGLTVGAVAQLWGGSSLQNGYALVTDKTTWQTQMEQRLDALLVVPFDLVELGMGEFFASDPEGVVQWLDHGTKYLAEKYPKTTFSVVNHVGNYPNLYLDFRGEKNVFFYHLPRYADPRLMNNVHTVYFFDLYRPYGGYGHADFKLHRDYIFAELPKRKVRYFPEAAYWASADVDVPIFLPEYAHARFIDIHNLDADIRAKRLPALDGHVTFSSGHEWGYWLNEYLTAKMMWEPERSFESFLEDYTRVFGSCGADAGAQFKAFVDLQTTYLFDKKLVPYLAGEDAHDDFGSKSGITTIPERPAFEKLLTMDDATRAQLEGGDLAGLGEFVAKGDPILDEIAARCRGADAALRPWCEELRDGIEIDLLRARHAIALYRAVLAHVRKQGDGLALLTEARAITERAKVVVERRAAGYRFAPSALTSPGKNATIYPFGYLRQAHAQCFWKRREEQVAWILENNEAPQFSKVPSCQD